MLTSLPFHPNYQGDVTLVGPVVAVVVPRGGPSPPDGAGSVPVAEKDYAQRYQVPEYEVHQQKGAVAARVVPPVDGAGGEGGLEVVPED